jgi:hypothetical protein
MNKKAVNRWNTTIDGWKVRDRIPPQPTMLLIPAWLVSSRQVFVAPVGGVCIVYCLRRYIYVVDANVAKEYHTLI